MSAELRGRRIHHIDGAEPFYELTQRGDYMGPLTGFTGTDERVSVFYLLPVEAPWDAVQGGSLQFKSFLHVTSPPWGFIEHEEDGSLEIEGSLLVTKRWKGEEWKWHGWLKPGNIWVWD